MALDLPTLNGRGRERYAEAKHDMTTRLEQRADTIRDDKADERAWRIAVIARDGKVCRCCGRKVVPQLALAPERLEVHHIKGRAHLPTRWDVRNGLVLCCACHTKLTQHKLFIVQAARYLFVLVGGQKYLNGDHPMDFKECA